MRLRELIPKRMHRLQFRISDLLLLTTLAAVYLAISTYPEQRQRQVVGIYDAQKVAYKNALTTFVAQLRAEGFEVTDDSRESGGSGEWRYHAAVMAKRAGEEPLLCYVEVQGFVSHDDNDNPDWMNNLPMSISARGKPLDERFIAMLTRRLRERGWDYEVNDRCKGLGHFPVR